MHGQRTWRRATLGGLVAAAALGLVPVVAGAPAGAQSVGDAVEACEPVSVVPEAGPRSCGGVERSTWLAAQHCRRVPPAKEPICPSIDGRPVHESAMAAYEEGFVARALDLQRGLGVDVPLTEALILHTHNSGNSTAYDPSVTINDANQVLSVTDQLRLGIRGIELDLHWTPHPDGDPERGQRAVVQCHGQSAGTPAGSIHPGCSIDRTFDAHLAELAAWFERPEAEGELVVLYLENQLVEDEGHAAAVESLEARLGDLLYRPGAGGGCQELPVARTPRELMADGAQVILTGNCGPGGWTDLVFERGAAWDESGSSSHYPDGSDCDAARLAGDYDNRFIRRYEDSTFLSLMVNGGSHISPEDAASMVRCGVNFPGLDQVHPDDDRLPALVWSWRADVDLDDPTAGCAAQGDDGRFVPRPCDEVLPVACRTVSGWAVSAQAVAWDEGELACRADGHLGAGVPANGWDNELLRRQADAPGDVWLAYGRQQRPDGSEAWAVGIPTTDPDDGEPGEGGGPGRRPTDPGRPSTLPRPDHAGPPAGRGPGGPTSIGAVPARGSTPVGPAAGALLATLGLAGLFGAGLRRRSAAR